MVHGLATNMAFWYFHYASVFARRYRVTVYDLRGHGRSEMPPGGYTPRNMARDLEALLDHLAVPRAHFLVHSFGGVVTLNLAQVAPERIASLVLADTNISAARGAAALAWDYGASMQHLLDAAGMKLDTRDPYFGYRLLTEVARLQLNREPVPHGPRQAGRPAGRQRRKQDRGAMAAVDGRHLGRAGTDGRGRPDARFAAADALPDPRDLRRQLAGPPDRRASC